MSALFSKTSFPTSNLFELATLSFESCLKQSNMDVSLFDPTFDYSHIYPNRINKIKGMPALSQEEKLKIIQERGGVIAITSKVPFCAISEFISGFESPKALYSTQFLVETDEIKNFILSKIVVKPPTDEEFVKDCVQAWTPNLKIITKNEAKDLKFTLFHGWNYQQFNGPKLFTQQTPQKEVTNSFMFA